jgi:hypothetical protein
MAVEGILHGAYNLARTAHQSGMLRGDVLALGLGLLGAAGLFYGSQWLPERWKIKDNSPIEYLSPQIETLRYSFSGLLRPLL